MSGYIASAEPAIGDEHIAEVVDSLNSGRLYK
jgi:hypothetical protein